MKELDSGSATFARKRLQLSTFLKSTNDCIQVFRQLITNIFFSFDVKFPFPNVKYLNAHLQVRLPTLATYAVNLSPFNNLTTNTCFITPTKSLIRVPNVADHSKSCLPSKTMSVFTVGNGRLHVKLVVKVSVKEYRTLFTGISYSGYRAFPI